MLRSMIIGMAVAALLEVGAHRVASVKDISLTRQIDWIQVQSEALTGLVRDGYVFLTR